MRQHPTCEHPGHRTSCKTIRRPAGASPRNASCYSLHCSPRWIQYIAASASPEVHIWEHVARFESMSAREGAPNMRMQRQHRVSQNCSLTDSRQLIAITCAQLLSHTGVDASLSTPPYREPSPESRPCSVAFTKAAITFLFNDLQVRDGTSSCLLALGGRALICSILDD